ncbi:MAG: DUF4149 domain-containing protein [Isosphaeraceae bacterium]
MLALPSPSGPARIASWGIWVGGFIFYGGLVVPIQHELLESLSAGNITRHVTDVLNRVGLASVAIWALAASSDRSAPSRWVRRVYVASIAASALLLAFLFAAHRPMDRLLDSGSMADFYPLHRIYLAASTAQWLANMAVVGCWSLCWTARPAPGEPS